ncbi:hypothetical protein BRADI_5g05832v3 [Brachypodium distachyon]|uniref:Uncharacterized protein n=1 Tax=Brachypodium distachyon TaxID=15368 RepID=A0A0Q3P0A2_BRADI|nr:hypothetical protein BRADI_5g05832v3 [Brachypodium distachyon]
MLSLFKPSYDKLYLIPLLLLMFSSPRPFLYSFFSLLPGIPFLFAPSLSSLSVCFLESHPSHSRPLPLFFLSVSPSTSLALPPLAHAPSTSPPLCLARPASAPRACCPPAPLPPCSSTQQLHLSIGPSPPGIEANMSESERRPDQNHTPSSLQNLRPLQAKRKASDRYATGLFSPRRSNAKSLGAFRVEALRLQLQ